MAVLFVNGANLSIRVTPIDEGIGSDKIKYFLNIKTQKWNILDNKYTGYD